MLKYIFLFSRTHLCIGRKTIVCCFSSVWCDFARLDIVGFDFLRVDGEGHPCLFGLLSFLVVLNIGESAIYGLIMCHLFKKVDTEYQWHNGHFSNVLIPNYIISFDLWLLYTFNFRTHTSKYIQLRSSSYAHAQNSYFNMQTHNPFLSWQLFLLLNVSHHLSQLLYLIFC